MTVLTARSPKPASPWPLHASDIVRHFVAILLLLAALLKAYELATTPVPRPGWLNSRWLLIPAVHFELLLAAGLLANLWPRLTRRVAIACFALFSILTLSKLLADESSCGCFGRIQVHPRYTLLLDLATLAALVFFRPPSPSTTRPRSAPRLLAVAALPVLAAAFWMVPRSSSTLAEDGALLGQGSLVILEPQKWITKRFPLLAHIDIGPQLLTGRWTVLLLHHDCPKCQSVLARYQQLAPQASEPKVALVQVPPYGPLPGNPTSPWLPGKLTDRKDWFVATPVELHLENGVVVKVTEENL